MTQLKELVDFHEQAGTVKQNRFEFPSEPPVATSTLPNGAQQARARVSAAERTLAGEHRSALPTALDGRRSGNSFPLVSSELCLRLPCAV